MDMKKFLEERRAVLMSGDLKELVAFARKHNPGFSFPDDETLEISLHKARTGALDLPIEMRRASHKWLKERGYGSFDDSLEEGGTEASGPH